MGQTSGRAKECSENRSRALCVVLELIEPDLQTSDVSNTQELQRCFIESRYQVNGGCQSFFASPLSITVRRDWSEIRLKCGSDDSQAQR